MKDPINLFEEFGLYFQSLFLKEFVFERPRRARHSETNPRNIIGNLGMDCFVGLLKFIYL